MLCLSPTSSVMHKSLVVNRPHPIILSNVGKGCDVEECSDFDQWKTSREKNHKNSSTFENLFALHSTDAVRAESRTAECDNGRMINSRAFAKAQGKAGTAFWMA